MARVCRKIQERIEKRRKEAREDCRNVTRTISETICSWLPWPFDDICDLVTRVITEVVCTIVYVVITVVSWITRIVCEIVHIAIWIVTHIVGFLEWLGNRILTLPELLLCVIGVRPIPKNYRICPLVIADEKGTSVVPVAEIEAEIQTAIRVWAQCGIRVIASPVVVVNGKSHLATASGCNASGYFGGDRAEFETLTCCNGILESLRCLRFPSGLIWPRHVLKAIWVRSISSGERGCYLLPESFILIASTRAPDTLAHEMGHAGDLLHRDEADNLMTTPTRTASNLTGWQCCVVRTSRFVTMF
ncbi:hypothetical protein FBQ90_10330 [Betaproteobacteria bacterium PRO5]|nr:hypothetical protein [Betaproteobacteria bacterium PRO5]